MNAGAAILGGARVALRRAQAGDGLPAKKGELAYQRAELFYLLKECHHEAVPPPAELIEVARIVLEYPDPIEEFWYRIGFNVTRDHWKILQDCAWAEAKAPYDPKFKNPSSLKTKPLADRFGVTRDTMKRWRRDDEYRRLVKIMRGSLEPPDNAEIPGTSRRIPDPGDH